jgi:hypothetical protein
MLTRDNDYVNPFSTYHTILPQPTFHTILKFPQHLHTRSLEKNVKKGYNT